MRAHAIESGLPERDGRDTSRAGLGTSAARAHARVSAHNKVSAAYPSARTVHDHVCARPPPIGRVRMPRLPYQRARGALRHDAQRVRRAHERSASPSGSRRVGVDFQPARARVRTGNASAGARPERARLHKITKCEKMISSLHSESGFSR